MERLVVGWLYPELMNIYGDRGNILSFQQRTLKRGISFEVRKIDLGETSDLEEVNLFFFGGGQDRDQELVFADLSEHKAAALEAAVERGVPVLAVCGGYQLVGHSYVTAEGRSLPGLGLLDITTTAGSTRCIGNVVLESDPTLALEPKTVVGFENHIGRTELGARANPLGQVRSGYGNNSQDGYEGAVQGNIFGTYLHGSLLPKNPHLTDLLIERALGHPLSPLDSPLELAAHQQLVQRTLDHRSSRR